MSRPVVYIKPTREALADYERAPSTHPFPSRFHVMRTRDTPVQLWLAYPTSGLAPYWPLQQIPGLGRREVTLPKYTRLAATWREAMDYVTTGKQPTPIEQIYPEYCGLP